MSKGLRTTVSVLVAAVGIYLGIRLAMYSEQDDAPGGVLIAGALMIGAVAFSIWFARRGPKVTSGTLE